MFCCFIRGKLLDASREENALLIAELRELEERVSSYKYMILYVTSYLYIYVLRMNISVKYSV